MHSIKFQPHQRDELLKMGIEPRALDYIELEALPFVRAYLTRPPRNKDVSDELAQLEAKLTAARDGIERLLNATAGVPHLKTARAQVSADQGRHMLGGLRLDRTSKALTEAIQLLADAAEQIPESPLRHKAAGVWPIKAIHQALQAGTIEVTRDVERNGPPPSASPNSDFRRLVGLCYEAAGADNTDPERAIKAYVQEYRELERHLVKMGLVTERPRKT